MYCGAAIFWQNQGGVWTPVNYEDSDEENAERHYCPTQEQRTAPTKEQLQRPGYL